MEALPPASGFEGAPGLVTRAIADVMNFSIDNVEGTPDAMPLVPVLALLDRVGGELMTLSELITHCYFSHVQTTHSLSFAPMPAPERLPA